MTSTCWRSECRTVCYYPDACSEAPGRKDSEGWASYAAEQERHAETAQARDAHYEARNMLAAKVDHLEQRLADMTREARLSREATEKVVATRVSRSEIERALRAAGPPEDSMATDELLVHYEGRAEAVEIIRIMLGWDAQAARDEAAAAEGLHPCVGCGLELDGDDPNTRCDECAERQS